MTGPDGERNPRSLQAKIDLFEQNARQDLFLPTSKNQVVASIIW